MQTIIMLILENIKEINIWDFRSEWLQRKLELRASDCNPESLCFKTVKCFYLEK